MLEDQGLLWVELCPSNLYVEVLTPTQECDLI